MLGCTCQKCRATASRWSLGGEPPPPALAITYAAIHHGLVRHECRVQGVMHIEAGEPCNWCDIVEPAPWLASAASAA
jgi:hypothetical protein